MFICIPLTTRRKAICEANNTEEMFQNNGRRQNVITYKNKTIEDCLVFTGMVELVFKLMVYKASIWFILHCSKSNHCRILRGVARVESVRAPCHVFPRYTALASYTRRLEETRGHAERL